VSKSAKRREQLMQDKDFLQIMVLITVFIFALCNSLQHCFLQARKLSTDIDTDVHKASHA